MNNTLIRPTYENLKLDDIILPSHTKPHSDYDDTRVEDEEKDMLLLPMVQEDAEGFGLLELRIAFGILLAILILFVPKIYLSSTIYYLSKEITSLQAQHDMLLEENKHLKHDVEDLRYKFVILKP